MSELGAALKEAGEGGRLPTVSDRALLVVWGELLGAAPTRGRAFALFRVEQEAKARGLTFVLHESPRGGLEAVNVFGGITYALPVVLFFRLVELAPNTMPLSNAWFFLINNMAGGSHGRRKQNRVDQQHVQPREGVR